MAVRTKVSGSRMIAITPAKVSDASLATASRNTSADELEEVVVDLPASARVTFGPDIPNHSKMPRPAETMVYCVRVYRDRTNASLCAVFPRVLEWRDCDIHLLSHDKQAV